MDKIINHTKNGKVFRCSDCNKIHIEYKNLNFNFNDDEYEYFTNYIKKLNGHYWENINSQAPYLRKIIVPIGHGNVRILLNNSELQEFKKLLLVPIINIKGLPPYFKFGFSNN